MSENPDRIEEQLRHAMRAHTDATFAAPGLARTALRGAARTNRLQHAATAAASVAAVGAVTATAVLVQHSPGRGSGVPALAGGLPTASASCYDTASPTPAVSMTASPSDVATTLAPSIESLDKIAGSASEQIKAVKLANPAPGYPLRRNSDALVVTGFGSSPVTSWTATFLLAQQPSVTTSMAGGGQEITPTGPEATVLVIDGHPFDLTNPTQIEGVPVSGTTTVLGHQAWITNACDQTDLVFSTGRFQVLLAAAPGGGSAAQAANVASLKAVAQALQGLQ